MNSGDFDAIQVPHAETWRALEGCVDGGLATHIGVSNFNEAQPPALLDLCTAGVLGLGALEAELREALCRAQGERSEFVLLRLAVEVLAHSGQREGVCDIPREGVSTASVSAVGGSAAHAPASGMSVRLPPAHWHRLLAHAALRVHVTGQQVLLRRLACCFSSVHVVHLERGRN